MDTDELALRELHREWIAAVNAGDLPRLLGLMADDVVFLAPGQAPAGRAAFPAAFSAAHERFHVRCSSTLEELGVAGALAYTLSRDALSLVPRGGGEPAGWAGHRMTLYRRRGDGRWCVARDIHTLAAAAA